jgi:mono/diheme cytochrome c family protein
MLGTYVFAADFRGIGLSVAAIVFLGFCAVFIWNMVRARPELGSEIELAANRKEYLSDEELEGEKLDRSLSFALVLLTLLAITLPFYWIAEPGRQNGAIDAYNLSFESRGEGSYVEGAQCINCHAGGGVGGGAAYVLQDADGQFIANASWKAPALNNVLLRYSEDEVRYILNFGRPGSPMAAWGTAGGGPLTTQQVNNIIIYLRLLQNQSLDPIDIAAAGTDDPGDEESLAAAEEAAKLQAEVEAEVMRSVEAGEYETVGEAVFNLGLMRDFGAGAYSCARCHTAGWSLGLDVVPDLLDEGVAGCGGGSPSGIGFNLCGGSVKNHFPDDAWLRPDGTWYGPDSPAGYDGSFIEANDGTRIALNDSGNPVTDSGENYLILGPAEGEDGDAQNGDLAECAFVSGLWQPEAGLAYPFDPAIAVAYDEETETFVDPAPLDVAAVEGDTMVLEDNRIVSGCTITEMPPRTSVAQFDFIYRGADAGTGYGDGGLSSAGMMPGFGKTLPPELIQAVVDYVRGL